MGKRARRSIVCALSVLSLTAAGTLAAEWYRLRLIVFPAPPAMAVWEYTGGRVTVRFPGRSVLAEVARYDDELLAYLMFSHLRTVPTLKPAGILMTHSQGPGGTSYPILAHVEGDLTSAVELLSAAQARNVISDFTWRAVDGATLDAFRYQTRVFVTAYNLPRQRNLESLTRDELAAYLRRFVQYKSMVDPRVAGRIEPVPRPLTQLEAVRVAFDIVAVGEFYRVPLDLLLGIGAMENNYMDVPGDLAHNVWKRRAEPGDVVVARRRGKVLVRNPSAGIWQITRQTLRYAHRLYLKDTRDYSLLPARLRPAQELDLDRVSPDTLTTYAGILVRDLLDHFAGDAGVAAGAYNGGIKKPNARYEAGVRHAAEYARQFVEHAAVLQGQSAAGMRFFVPARTQ